MRIWQIESCGHGFCLHFGPALCEGGRAAGFNSNISKTNLITWSRAEILRLYEMLSPYLTAWTAEKQCWG